MTVHAANTSGAAHGVAGAGAPHNGNGSGDGRGGGHGNGHSKGHRNGHGKGHGGVRGGPPPANQPEPAPHDAAVADLRGQVVDRLRQMSALHAQHAWYRRNRDPIGPHAVAFLYAESVAADPLRYRLRTATRLVRDGPDVAEAPRLLYELSGIARGYLDAGAFDPRTQMADRCEPMSDRAFYAGLAVSTLDTPTGAWPQVRQRVAGPLDIPGRGLALLADTTMLVVDRRGQDEYGAFHVQCTHSLDVVPGQPDRMWRWNRELANLDDPSTCDIWRFMNKLHALIAGAGHVR